VISRPREGVRIAPPLLSALPPPPARPCPASPLTWTP